MGPLSGYLSRRTTVTVTDGDTALHLCSVTSVRAHHAPLATLSMRGSARMRDLMQCHVIMQAVHTTRKAHILRLTKRRESVLEHCSALTATTRLSKDGVRKHSRPFKPRSVLVVSLCQRSWDRPIPWGCADFRNSDNHGTDFAMEILGTYPTSLQEILDDCWLVR